MAILRIRLTTRFLAAIVVSFWIVGASVSVVHAGEPPSASANLAQSEPSASMAGEVPPARRLMPSAAASPAPAVTDAEGVDLRGWLLAPEEATAEVVYPTVVVTGFFQADGIWISQDEANFLVVGDARDTADFRRARLAAKGNVSENVAYMIEFDFAFPGRPSFMDVYLDIADTPWGDVRVGQWRQPFSMDALTSVRELTFMERGLPFAMVPFRQIGVGLYDTALDERATWAVSGYRFPTDTFGNASGDSGYGLSTRATALLHGDSRSNDSLHVGAGYTWNEPSTNLTRIRTAPEVGFNQLDFRNVDFPIPFFVDTGPIPTDTYQVFGAELAASRGPLLLQSELICSLTDQIDGPELFFPGAYAQASYVLTGEHRIYNKQQGVYGRVIPRCDYGRRGKGAWEIAARWSYLDLTDSNIDGGVLNDLTFGTNWYLNRFTKFQFNYIHAFLDRPIGFDSDSDIIAARAQLDF